MDRDTVINAFCSGFNAYLTRTKQTSKEIAKKLSCCEANVSKWKKYNGLPSLECVFELAKNGMTLQEIFGPELAGCLSVEFQKNLATSDPAAAKNQTSQILEFLNEKLKEFKPL